MRVRAPKWIRIAAVWVLGLGLLAAPARAEDPKPFQEPGIVYADPGGLYIQWLAGALFIAAVVLIAIKNPHRSHMD